MRFADIMARRCPTNRFIRLILPRTQWGKALATSQKDGTFRCCVFRMVPSLCSTNELDKGWWVNSVPLGADDLVANGLEGKKRRGVGVQSKLEGATVSRALTAGTVHLPGRWRSQLCKP